MTACLGVKDQVTAEVWQKESCRGSCRCPGLIEGLQGCGEELETGSQFSEGAGKASEGLGWLSRVCHCSEYTRLGWKYGSVCQGHNEQREGYAFCSGCPTCSQIFLLGI